MVNDVVDGRSDSNINNINIKFRTTSVLIRTNIPTKNGFDPKSKYIVNTNLSLHSHCNNSSGHGVSNVSGINVSASLAAARKLCRSVNKFCFGCIVRIVSIANGDGTTGSDNCITKQAHQIDALLIFIRYVLLASIALLSTVSIITFAARIVTSQTNMEMINICVCMFVLKKNQIECQKVV